MKRPCNRLPCRRNAIDAGGPPPGYLIRAEHRNAVGDLLQGSTIAPCIKDFLGRLVLIASAYRFRVALALIEFDGLAQRITLYSPDLGLEHLANAMRYAEVDA